MFMVVLWSGFITVSCSCASVSRAFWNYISPCHRIVSTITLLKLILILLVMIITLIQLCLLISQTVCPGLFWPFGNYLFLLLHMFSNCIRVLIGQQSILHTVLKFMGVITSIRGNIQLDL